MVPIRGPLQWEGADKSGHDRTRGGGREGRRRGVIPFENFSDRRSSGERIIEQAPIRSACPRIFFSQARLRPQP